jgi:predicted nucleic acid-binding protein
MVDTNIFSNLVSGELRIESLPCDGEFWATPVQREELYAAPSDIREQLVSKFKEFVDPQSLVGVSFSFDIPGAGFDEGVWNHDPSVFNAVKADLHEAWEMLPAKQKKRKKKENNAKDALIAEAAKRGDFTLLTADYHLAEVTKKHGIKVCYLKPRREAGSGKY